MWSRLEYLIATGPKSSRELCDWVGSEPVSHTARETDRCSWLLESMFFFRSLHQQSGCVSGLRLCYYYPWTSTNLTLQLLRTATNNWLSAAIWCQVTQVSGLTHSVATSGRRNSAKFLGPPCVNAQNIKSLKLWQAELITEKSQVRQRHGKASILPQTMVFCIIYISGLLNGC